MSLLDLQGMESDSSTRGAPASVSSASLLTCNDAASTASTLLCL